MSEFKGTPGPWCRGGVENGKVSINAGNYFVALVDEGNAQMANAKLIIAAPDLLSALQDLVHSAARGVKNCTAQVVALEKARAAISKATGE